MIELDVPARTLTLHVGDAELRRRRASWSPPPMPRTGYAWLYTQHVLQADQGADFGFLRGTRGHDIPRDSH
jgi:dihydroxyacid dehydratase/phosphogluconate dehydratase